MMICTIITISQKEKRQNTTVTNKLKKINYSNKDLCDVILKVLIYMVRIRIGCSKNSNY